MLWEKPRFSRWCQIKCISNEKWFNSNEHFVATLFKRHATLMFSNLRTSNNFLERNEMWKLIWMDVVNSSVLLIYLVFISQLWKKQSWQSLFVNYIKTQQLHVMLNDSEVLWTKVESNWRARITFCLTMKNNSCRVSSSVEVGNSWYLLWNVEKFQILLIFGFQYWTKIVSCPKIWEMGILH